MIISPSIFGTVWATYIPRETNMKATIFVEPTDKKNYCKIEIHYPLENSDIGVVGQDYCHVDDLDLFVNEFKANHDYNLVQWVNGKEKSLEWDS